jgi:hypothetical protein
MAIAQSLAGNVLSQTHRGRTIATRVAPTANAALRCKQRCGARARTAANVATYNATIARRAEVDVLALPKVGSDPSRSLRRYPLVVECMPHLPREPIGREGLLDERDVRIENAMA